jgi:predicted membrane protein (TIGR00267 family)
MTSTESEQLGKDQPVHGSARTNWIRAAVLGANDGIVSIAGLVVGVAGATDNKLIILAAGVAGILAGALSMAAGEYVSVSTQREIEKKILHAKNDGHTPGDEDELTNPWHAAVASAASFFLGSLIPMVAIMLPLGNFTIPVTFASVIIALVITGYLSGKLGGINIPRSIVRVVFWGVVAMGITYSVGALFGVAGL